VVIVFISSDRNALNSQCDEGVIRLKARVEVKK